VQLDGNAILRMSPHAREASGGCALSNVSRMSDSLAVHRIVRKPLRRVCLISTASGCGKSTTGVALAERMNVPYYELDALHHGPNWEPCSADEMRARVEPIVQGESWVVDGTYRGKIGDLVPEAADLVVWLDLPVRVWLPRLLRRTSRRVFRKEELWNGNRERWRDVLHPTNSVVVYALRNYRQTRRTLEVELAGFRVARLRSPAEVERFLESVEPVS
jgi:adenylate kinase family enzyme